MSRDLIDPRFQTSFDPGSQRLRQANPSVEVDAVGAYEADFVSARRDPHLSRPRP